MVRQRKRRIHFPSGFFSSFDAPWSERSWIDLSSKETKNPFSDCFGFGIQKNAPLDYEPMAEVRYINLALLTFDTKVPFDLSMLNVLFCYQECTENVDSVRSGCGHCDNTSSICGELDTQNRSLFGII